MAKTPSRIALPPKPKRPHRDELARPLSTMRDVANHVRELREGLDITQGLLAARAGVGRHWIVALEQAQPTLEVAKVLRVLETLGFELFAVPYDPPPPWMLRACAAAADKREATAAAHAARKNLRRRERARERRVAENEPVGRTFLE